MEVKRYNPPTSAVPARAARTHCGKKQREDTEQQWRERIKTLKEKENYEDKVT